MKGLRTERGQAVVRRRRYLHAHSAAHLSVRPADPARKRLAGRNAQAVAVWVRKLHARSYMKARSHADESQMRVGEGSSKGAPPGTVSGEPGRPCS